MKRKTILLAKNTLVVSLPHKWVKEYGVRKGDELNIVKSLSNLVISTDNSASPKIIETDVSGYNSPLLWYSISSLYREGYEEINLTFDRETRTKEGKAIITINQIKKITDKLIGMEILKFGERHCLIKEISSAKPEEFQALWRRILFAVIEMCAELNEAKKAEDFRRISEYSEDSINKMTNFAIRILHQRSPYDGIQTLRAFHLLQSVEEMADYFALCARNKKAPEKIKEVQELLQLLYTHLAKPRKETWVSIHKKKDELEKTRELAAICDKIMQAAAWVVPA